jgi:hypothetical protein
MWRQGEKVRLAGGEGDASSRSIAGPQRPEAVFPSRFLLLSLLTFF